MKIYEERFGSELGGSGRLMVIKRLSGTYTIAAYLPPGISVNDCPEVLVNGTLDDCRAKWNASKAWIKKLLGI